MTPAVLPFVLLAAFQAKHLLADFYWQSGWMVRTKGIYGHPGGLAHTGLHVGLSGLILLCIGLPAALFAGVLAAEFAVHYHTDWAKDRLVRRGGLTASQARFWNMTGLDQFVHQLTYLGMVAGVSLGAAP